jgi:hypothetical protein
VTSLAAVSAFSKINTQGVGPAPIQPCRCLWRRFSQITMTRPWRRITLHLSQIGLTLGLTFKVDSLS